MDHAAALRESWALYRQHVGGPLTVGWDDLPEQRREAWRIVTAPFRRTPESDKSKADTGKAAP